nr:MAG TPA: hypothetical protein [Caudoviricetes sp.]
MITELNDTEDLKEREELRFTLINKLITLVYPDTKIVKI